MCMLHIPAAFCLGDRDFCCCEKCMDKCPEYNFVGTTMSRPSCEKPECPQPGKKRKATVAHTGKENEQEGGSEPPYEWRRTLMEASFRVHASHTCRLLLGRPRLL